MGNKFLDATGLSTLWNIILNMTSSTYTPQTRSIAGVNLQNNITKAELQNALELQNLAYKNSASGTISTIDSINSFTVAQAGTYNISGDAVSVPVTYNNLDVTPYGNVNITQNASTTGNFAIKVLYVEEDSHDDEQINFVWANTNDSEYFSPAVITEGVVTATFNGQTKNVTPTVATTANAIGGNATVAINSTTITPGVVATNKTITIS